MLLLGKPLFEKRRNSDHFRFIGSLALLLALIVFYIDTFTGIQGAVAVLYVIVLLLLGEIMTRNGVFAVASACFIATVFSFLYGHGLEPDLSPALRLSVALSAVCITAVLLLRNDTFRAELLAKNAALRESEARYRSIFDGTRVALWERDYSRLNGALMELRKQGVADIKEYARTRPAFVEECIDTISTKAANDAARELLGTVADDGPAGLRHRHISADTGAFLDLLQAMLDKKASFQAKANVTAENGDQKQVLLSVRFPEDPAAFNRVVVSMLDITQRELTQKALEEARTELTHASRAATVAALSASLAHELNQPLGAIVVNSQTLSRWLDRDPPDLPAAKRSAERMERDALRASEIIRNTRGMLSHSTPEPETVDLKQLVDETLALMDDDLQRHRISVDLSSAMSGPTIRTVRIELQQVLINLITNATQAMSTTSDCREIQIRFITDDAQWTKIAIRDNGPGISADVAPKLFTPFFTTKASGMGMGLSICRSTLQARGGALAGYNHPDGGAVFEISLPVEGSDD